MRNSLLGTRPLSHAGLTVLPKAPQRLPRQAGPGKGTRQRGDYIVPVLADPGRGSARRQRARLEAVILRYFDTNGSSNGPTQAINSVIETTRRIAADSATSLDLDGVDVGLHAGSVSQTPNQSIPKDSSTTRVIRFW
jgi:hypothetical protein